MIARHAIISFDSPFNSASNDILTVVLKYSVGKKVRLKIIGYDTIFSYHKANKIFPLYF